MTGNNLSSDTIEFLFWEFDEKLRFPQTLTNHLHLKGDRLYHIHSNEILLRQNLYQMIAGYTEDDAADHLRDKPVFTQIIGTDALASQSILSLFFNGLMPTLWHS